MLTLKCLPFWANQRASKHRSSNHDADSQMASILGQSELKQESATHPITMLKQKVFQSHSNFYFSLFGNRSKSTEMDTFSHINLNDIYLHVIPSVSLQSVSENC